MFLSNPNLWIKICMVQLQIKVETLIRLQIQLIWMDLGLAFRAEKEKKYK